MFENNFTRWHALVACALWLVFAALTLVIVLRGLDHAAQRPLTVLPPGQRIPRSVNASGWRRL